MAQLTNIEVSYKEKEFFERFSNEGEPLELRKSRCSDCPATDMYLEINERLAKQDPLIQLKCAKRNFCHQTPCKSCRGLSDYLRVKGDLDIKDGTLIIKGSD
ncbi:hypothetical protein ACMFKE_11380 [Staphylococcus haemolyticus]|uniref:hypothetical protein n=1 Tax=Staphylococcus haemolyticus TaxID=1283 RepID=UPI001F0A702E|nr:hypothetical protein [Staphylococcus haemolyticus]MCH4489292.1 hypothetical protein [Staphylococcus haemolyticus]